MKLLLNLSILFCFGCHNQTEKKFLSPASNIIIDSVNKKVDTSLYTAFDTIKIANADLDTLKYGKEEFNEIISHFPDLYDDLHLSPDISYYRSGIFKDIIDEMGNKKHISFGSEVGQDEYYLLYAYFLKMRNGENKFDSVRNTLLKIFNDINNLFGELAYGGTYYGHQKKRIFGYAEHYIYLYKNNVSYYEKTYDISKQKTLYINSLKQFILDEESIDNNNTYKGNKDKRKSELFETVNEINSLITNYFYLDASREFQYSNY